MFLSANSLWNIAHFRSHLVNALASGGAQVVIAAPASADETADSSLPAAIVPVAIDRSGLNPFRDMTLAREYFGLMRRRRPAAYLGWTIKPNIYGAFAARWAGVPSLHNVSGLGTAFLGNSAFGWFVGWLYRAAFKRAHVVFFQNRDDRDLFVGRRIVRPDQARLLPGSGIDLAQFEAAPLPDGPPVFLLVARLLGDKGVREFVAAAKTVRAVLPAARFQLLGPLDGDNRTAISRCELDHWVGEGAVEYLGTARDVRPHLRAATVVVLPSYREGLPRTLLEAAATGRPLVATDVPGCRDVVQDGVNGLLCPARDAEGLASAMQRIAALDRPTLEVMGAASRRLVESSFGVDRVTDAYLQALAELG